MKKWLRFEDMYGLCDIFCACNNIEYTTTSKTCADKYILETGASNPGCFVVTNPKIESMKVDGAGECIIFFDIDPVRSKDIVLTSEWFRAKAIKRDFVTYAPVVWCAETLACICLGIGVDELLHPANSVAEKLGDKRTKRFRDILPKNGIRDTLLQHSQSSKYNQKVIDVICNGSKGYSYDDAVIFLDKLYQDINSSVDELWDMVPPSLRSSHTGSKEDLLRQLGLL